MIDFIVAAIPWIAFGLSIAIILANTKIKNNNNHVITGMSLGMCFGLVIGSLTVDSHGPIDLAYGMSIGMFIGILLGLLFKKK